MLSRCNKKKSKNWINILKWKWIEFDFSFAISEISNILSCLIGNIDRNKIVEEKKLFHFIKVMIANISKT